MAEGNTLERAAKAVFLTAPLAALHGISYAVTSAGKGFYDFFTGPLPSFISDTAYRKKIVDGWRTHTLDMSMQENLNRKATDTFLQSLRSSKLDQLSVSANRLIEEYEDLNRLHYSPLMRFYKFYARQNFLVKILSVVGFSIGMRFLLSPFLGFWGILVPLSTLVSLRMADSYQRSKIKTVTQKLADEGLVVPQQLEVIQGKMSFLGREINQDIILAFPVMYGEIPRWTVAHLDHSKGNISDAITVHAAAAEALKTGRVLWQDFSQIHDTYADGARFLMRDPIFAMALLFPGKSLEEITSLVHKLSEENVAMSQPFKVTGLTGYFMSSVLATKTQIVSVPLPQAILRTLENFTVRGNPDEDALKSGAGLSALAGKVTEDDLRWLVGLHAAGVKLDRRQVKTITGLLSDPRFSISTAKDAVAPSFRNIVEVALLPDDSSALLREIWQDREFRSRFAFTDVKTMVTQFEAWGKAALSIARHNYSKNLTFDQIRELAQPANSSWAKVYHDTHGFLPEAAAARSHEELKAICREMGLIAPRVVRFMNEKGVTDVHEAIRLTRLDIALHPKATFADWSTSGEVKYHLKECFPAGQIKVTAQANERAFRSRLRMRKISRANPKPAT